MRAKYKKRRKETGSREDSTMAKLAKFTSSVRTSKKRVGGEETKEKKVRGGARFLVCFLSARGGVAGDKMVFFCVVSAFCCVDCVEACVSTNIKSQLLFVPTLYVACTHWYLIARSGDVACGYFLLRSIQVVSYVILSMGSYLRIPRIFRQTNP